MKKKIWMQLFGVLATSAVGLSPAHAMPDAPTPGSFNEALNYSYNPKGQGINTTNPSSDYYDQINTLNSGHLATAESSYDQSGSIDTADGDDNTITTNWAVHGYAQADLSAGTLKISTNASRDNIAANPYMQTNAIFGDSFTTKNTSGGLFSWSDASKATFNMTLDGTMHFSDGFTNASSFVILSILKKGTLTDSSIPYIGGSNSITTYLWEMGNQTNIFYTDRDGKSSIIPLTKFYQTIPDSFSATFAPEGDFDWVLVLGASGQLYGDIAEQSFSVDLANTLHVKYVGPDGGITTSDSGIFANIAPTGGTPVPEPITMFLFGTGIAGLSAVGRRKRS